MSLDHAGPEGIEAVPGRDRLVEDQPAAFTDAVNRLLAEAAWRRASASRQGGWRWSGMPGAGRPAEARS